MIIRFILIAVNGLLMIAGLALFGLGLWSIQYEKVIEQIPDIQSLATSIYMIIVASVVIVIVTFLGCCGAFFKRKWALGLYIIFMLLLTVFLMIGDGIQFFGKMKIATKTRDFMTYSLVNVYGTSALSGGNSTGNPSTSAAALPFRNPFENPTDVLAYGQTWFWDELQSKLECCGVDEKTMPQTYHLWSTSRWYRQILGNHTHVGNWTFSKEKENDFHKNKTAKLSALGKHSQNVTASYSKSGGQKTTPPEIIGNVDGGGRGASFERYISPQKVPNSCCPTTLNQTFVDQCVRLMEPGMSFIYSDGCYDKIIRMINKGNYFSSISLIVLLVMVLSIIFAVIILLNM